MSLASAVPSYGALNGLLLVYKRRHAKLGRLVDQLRRALCDDLNELAPNYGGIQPLPTSSGHVLRERVEPHPVTGQRHIVGEHLQPDYTLHERVTGSRHQVEDIAVEPVFDMDVDVSGLCLLAVNNGIELYRERVRSAQLLCDYALSGRWGEVRQDFKPGGTLIDTNRPYGHVTRHKVARVLTRMEAQHRRALYEHANVDPQSQAAFELAARGQLLPGRNSPPIHYTLRLAAFRPNRPNFVIRTHVLNEEGGSAHYLRLLVHNVGAQLRAGAVCTKIRRIRMGPLGVDDALLPRHFTLPFVCANMVHCGRLLAPTLARRERGPLHADGGGTLVAQATDMERPPSVEYMRGDEPRVQTNARMSGELRAVLADSRRVALELDEYDELPARQQPLLSWQAKRGDND